MGEQKVVGTSCQQQCHIQLSLFFRERERVRERERERREREIACELCQ